MDNSGSLWLEREPSVDEVKAEFAKFDIDKYREIVFCGFGEPTERLDDVLEVCRFIKDTYNNKTVRINTNGLADLIYEKNTAPMFEGLIDIVSISLNTPNKERYLELTRSKFGIGSFDAMIKFAENVKHYVKEVVLSTVATTLTKEEENECSEICDKIGVTYRIRPWED
jgi:TatD family-associated radical SAM protein